MKKNHPANGGPGGKPPWNKRHELRLDASLRTVRRFHPLVVCKHGDAYEIRDGHTRYEILQNLGETMIPCRVFQEVQQP
jgi:ParB-like chromosome segregation protein Spo0J